MQVKIFKSGMFFALLFPSLLLSTYIAMCAGAYREGNRIPITGREKKHIARVTKVSPSALTEPLIKTPGASYPWDY